MKQTEFHATPTPGTQNAAVLHTLQETAGQWVSMPTIATAMQGYAVHSRVSDLRRMGYQIEHRNEHRGGQVHSFYRLSSPDPVSAGEGGETAVGEPSQVRQT